MENAVAGKQLNDSCESEIYNLLRFFGNWETAIAAGEGYLSPLDIIIAASFGHINMCLITAAVIIS